MKIILIYIFLKKMLNLYGRTLLTKMEVLLYSGLKSKNVIKFGKILCLPLLLKMLASVSILMGLGQRLRKMHRFWRSGFKMVKIRSNLRKLENGFSRVYVSTRTQPQNSLSFMLNDAYLFNQSFHIIMYFIVYLYTGMRSSK